MVEAVEAAGVVTRAGCGGNVGNVGVAAAISHGAGGGCRAGAMACACVAASAAAGDTPVRFCIFRANFSLRCCIHHR